MTMQDETRRVVERYFAAWRKIRTYETQFDATELRKVFAGKSES